MEYDIIYRPAVLCQSMIILGNFGPLHFSKNIWSVFSVSANKKKEDIALNF